MAHRGDSLNPDQTSPSQPSAPDTCYVDDQFLGNKTWFSISLRPCAHQEETC